MRSGVLLLSACLFMSGFSGSLLYAQEESSGDSAQQLSEHRDILEELQDGILRIHIQARILTPDQDILWNVDVDELTIPGKGVKLRLNGGNIVVEAEFTPFRQRNNTIMLIAQGETWVENKFDNKLSYQTSMKSIPINAGSSVIFYPLGIDPRNGNAVNLELEITVSQYQSAILNNRTDDDPKEP